MAETLWANLLEEAQAEWDREEVRLWLEPLRPRAEAGGLVLRCPNDFHRNWVREHYLPRLKALLAAQGGAAELRLDLTPAAAPRSGPPRQMELPRLGPSLPGLNRRFVFESFVCGAGNEFACAAAKAMAGGKGLYCDSLFLVSGTGLGKTHLTQAVAHMVLGGDPALRVVYLSAEEFANQMIAALRRKRIHEFKERFRRGCDLLLLEEVQFLAGKDKTQEELVYTLDALNDAGKRVVFTGRQAPGQVKGLKPALASRLGESVTVGIEPPDQSTRRRILQRLAAEEGVAVPETVLEHLAQELSGDVRRLRSALVGLLARHSLTGQPMDLSLAALVLGQLASELRRISPEQIRDLVASLFGLEPTLITGKSRKKTVTGPRNLAMYLCRRHTEASYAAIGRVFNRDHATVMYGVEQIDLRLTREPKLAAELAFLEQRLGVAAA
ncbi:MAG: chromosomal replication initiator protein DnaA [Thermodesulfobacteriota bacterium]